jgi:hypothetical protein
VELETEIDDSHLLAPGEALQVKFQVVTDLLEVGVHSSSLVFNIRDAGYPDCFFDKDEQILVSVKILPRDCESSLMEPDASGECVCNSSSVEIAGGCMAMSSLLLLILLPTFLLLWLACCDMAG